MTYRQPTEFQNAREAVLFYAFQAFARNGYLNTTTKDIAELAQVNESTIFRQFESKEKLFRAVIHHYSMIRFEDVTKADHLLTYHDAHQDLDILFSFYYELTYQFIDVLRIFYINSPFISIDQETRFYVVPTIRLHFQNYLYRYFFDTNVSYQTIDFLVDFFLNHITRTISDLYGHNYFYQLDEFSEPFVRQAIDEQLELFSQIEKTIKQEK